MNACPFLNISSRVFGLIFPIAPARSCIANANASLISPRPANLSITPCTVKEFSPAFLRSPLFLDAIKLPSFHDTAIACPSSFSVDIASLLRPP